MVVVVLRLDMLAASGGGVFNYRVLPPFLSYLASPVGSHPCPSFMKGFLIISTPESCHAMPCRSGGEERNKKAGKVNATPEAMLSPALPVV